MKRHYFLVTSYNQPPEYVKKLPLEQLQQNETETLKIFNRSTQTSMNASAKKNTLDKQKSHHAKFPDPLGTLNHRMINRCNLMLQFSTDSFVHRLRQWHENVFLIQKRATEQKNRCFASIQCNLSPHQGPLNFDIV